MISSNRNLPLCLAASAALAVLLWQAATVRANYGGNWSALFCTGSLARHPPLVESEHVYQFANSAGYDGQEYHYIAHDPFFRSDLKSYVDDPRLRYRRILTPVLAFALALGHSAWIDPSYELVCLFSIALAVYWSCRFTVKAGLSPFLGLLLLSFPAVLISVDRLVIDGALAALTVAFLLHAEAVSWRLAAILMCAALARETGFLLVLACGATLACRRQFVDTALVFLSAVPALAWYGFVQAHTSPQAYPVSLVPLSAITQVVTHPWNYPPDTPLVGAVLFADYLALGGALLAFAFAFFLFIRRPSEPIRVAAALFAAMGVLVQRTDHWQNVYDFGRVYTPLLLLLAGLAARQRKPLLLSPLALMLPRIAMQFAPQALGVLRWI